MANVSGSRSGVLKATLRRVEAGLFRADYPGENNQEEADTEAFPDAHIGTNADGVKSWVEQMAAGLEYDRGEWVSPD